MVFGLFDSGNDETVQTGETSFNQPDWLANIVRSNVERAQGISSQDYPRYTGKRVADLSEDTLDAIREIQDLDEVGQAELSKAGRFIDMGSQIAAVAPEYIRSGLDLADRSIPFAERAGTYGIEAADFFSARWNYLA